MTPCAAANRPCTSPTTKRPRCWWATRCRRRPSTCWPPTPSCRRRAWSAMLRVLADAAGSTGMCGGQAIDLASVGISLTLAQLEHMHQLKTGALLRASVMLGALAGARYRRRRSWRRWTPIRTRSAWRSRWSTTSSTRRPIRPRSAKPPARTPPPTSRPMCRSWAWSLPRAGANFAGHAHEALAPFGEQGRRLRELADLIVQRKA